MPRILASNLLVHAMHWPLQPNKHEWETILPTPGYISLEENVLLLESVNGTLVLAISLEFWEELEFKSQRIKQIWSQCPAPREAVWHQTLWLVATCVRVDIWNYLPGEIHCLSWSGSPCISALSWHPWNVRRIWRDYTTPPKQVDLRTCAFSSTEVSCAVLAHLYSLFLFRLECLCRLRVHFQLRTFLCFFVSLSL